MTRPACRAIFLALALSLALSGCQTLRDWTGRASQDLEPPELSHVESRAFALLADQSVVGGLYSIRVREGDTLPDVARHFGLGYDEIVMANPDIDPWVPPAGSRVLLPIRHVVPKGPREGIVLNLANMRLYYYPPADGGTTVYTFAVGIGREGWETPTGQASVSEKKVNPPWFPPQSVLEEHEEKGDPLPWKVPPGPDNPLGHYAMRLSWPSYLIHGTNKPYGVGLQVSHGCVRLYPEDIARLFGEVEIGAPVRIVDQPYLAGWQNGTLYLEANPPLEGGGPHPEATRSELLARLAREAEQDAVAIDWLRVEQVLERVDGIPAPILAEAPDVRTEAAAAPTVAHPGRFYGQPVPVPLGEDEWSIAVGVFESELQARRVSAVLEHQGPPIPARPVPDEQGYRVIAGPFSDEEETLEVAERIRREFDFDPQPVAPRITDPGTD